jgi:hypothetical protein
MRMDGVTIVNAAAKYPGLVWAVKKFGLAGNRQLVAARRRAA